jgi:hypothetical protein
LRCVRRSAIRSVQERAQKGAEEEEGEEEEEEELSACRGEGSVVGPLLAARALPLRCVPSPGVDGASSSEIREFR